VERITATTTSYSTRAVIKTPSRQAAKRGGPTEIKDGAKESLGRHAPGWMLRSPGLIGPWNHMPFRAVTVPIVYVLARKKEVLHVGWTENLPAAVTDYEQRRRRKGLEPFSAVFWPDIQFEQSQTSVYLFRSL